MILYIFESCIKSIRNPVIILFFLAVLNLSACGGGGNDDDNGNTEASTDSTIFGLRFGDASADQGATAVVTDANNNIIVVGVFSGTIDFGAGAVNAMADDIFVAKFDANGILLWSRTFGGADEESVLDVALDSTGNVILGGYFDSAQINFGAIGVDEINRVGLIDLFLAKLSGNDGSHIWSWGSGGSNVWCRINALAVSPTDDSIAVTGNFNDGTIDLGGGNLTDTGSGQVFVARFNGSNGAHLQSADYGDADLQLARDIAVDSSGNLVVTGSFNGNIDFGNGNLMNAGMFSDIYLARLDPNLGHLYSVAFGGAGEDVGESVALDSNDNVILVGSFFGSIDFGGGVRTADSSTDTNMFIAKFDSSDVHLFSQSYGGAGQQESFLVTTGPSDEIFVAGSLSGEINFGGGTFSAAMADFDIVAARFTSDVMHLQSVELGDSEVQTVRGITVNGNRRLIGVGRFDGTIDFGTGTISSVGDDAYLISADLGVI